ncbi:hypothetical protein [Variovorax sp. MHTC-1]|uniref:hypothetical protein n=1 Tax=Variovorax sp. MHTC-1 TaxID=2495593 RepID=UPI000F865DF4|nr:hypothetical protein [Variovorax sp. MHTC-1]RST50126.1 hypothetical protein EJI01_22170 [Variovorax sp. MHTC-1]
MPRIVLSIDRLVLRGVERVDAAAVAAALQSELHALLASGSSTLATQGSAHALQAGQVRLPHGADAAALGRAVAVRIAGDPPAPAGNEAGAP